MAIAFAETASSGSWTPKSVFGLIVLAGIIFMIVRHKKKKKTKISAKQSDVTVTVTDKVPPIRYGDDPDLLSIAKFQKVVYNRFVVFDFETTGLSPENDKIVEIGAVRVEKGKITDRYQCLVNPGMSMPEAASNKNHITDDMLKNCQPIKKVLPDFLKFAGSDVLAAHNAGFDAAFLRAACKECRLDPPTAFFDTMRLSVYWPELKSRSLASFLKAAGIKNEDAHRALGDAEATAKLIIKSFDKIK
jgi:DNA polymerase III epsilon subunit family exonuclease